MRMFTRICLVLRSATLLLLCGARVCSIGLQFKRSASIRQMRTVQGLGLLYLPRNYPNTHANTAENAAREKYRRCKASQPDLHCAKSDPASLAEATGDCTFDARFEVCPSSIASITLVIDRGGAPQSIIQRAEMGIFHNSDHAQSKRNLVTY